MTPSTTGQVMIPRHTQHTRAGHDTHSTYHQLAVTHILTGDQHMVTHSIQQVTTKSLNEQRNR